jgi:hypothetical protein
MSSTGEGARSLTGRRFVTRGVLGFESSAKDCFLTKVRAMVILELEQVRNVDCIKGCCVEDTALMEKEVKNQG